MTAALSQTVLPLHSAADASVSQAQTSGGLQYRPLQPRDLEELKAAHAALFPIDYDLEFFARATNGLDRIWSCAAVSAAADGDAASPAGSEQLIGFITAKSVFLHEVDAADRQHMGLLSGVLDHDRVLYIMTLGVVEGHRHRGIASTLISIACQHAYETRCRCVFLHVITYNTAAMSLYSRQGFSCVAKLRAFYFIATGRTPDPQQQVYDAYLFVQYVGGAAGVPSPWDLVSMAWSPLRFAFNRIHSCVPGFCRAEQQQHPQQQQHLLDAAMPDCDQLSSSGGSSGLRSHGLHDNKQHQHQHQHHQHFSHHHLHHASHHNHHRHHHQHTHHHHGHHHHDHQQQQQHMMQPPQQEWHRNVPSVRQEQQQQQQEQLWGWQQPPAPPSAVRQEQQQEQSYALHQAMQPPQQRMLRWLFNGSSRGAAGGAAGAAGGGGGGGSMAAAQQQQ